MANIWFWLCIFLLILSAFSKPEWKWGSYATLILTVIALALLGLKVFGFSL